MEIEGMIGQVKNGAFVRYGSGSAGTARLTSIRPQEAISPEAREIPLQDFEGRIIVVRGSDQGAWIYAATIVDVHSGGAPSSVEFIRTLFRSGSMGTAFQGLIKPERPEPREGDPTKFSEGVTQETLLDVQVPNGMRVYRITYPRGGRTQWHWHEGEQALYAVEGTGIVMQDGQTPVTLEENRIVYVTPGVRHWHGALPADRFVHLAFTANGRTEWQEAVTVEDYDESTGMIGVPDG